MDLNRKTISLALAVLVTALLAWWLWPAVEPSNEKPNPIQSQPNVVSQADPAPQEQFDFKEWEKQQQTEMDGKADRWQAYVAGREVKSLEPNPSYLSAYRDYAYFERCLMMVDNVLNGGDEAIGALQIIDHNADLDQILSEQQHDSLFKRISRCESLVNFESGAYYAQRVWLDLKAKYQSIPPKSPEEIELAMVLADIDLFKQIHSELNVLKQGEHVDLNLHFELTNQRQALRNQYPRKPSMFGGYAPEDQELVDQLDQQMATVEAQIEANQTFDHDQIKTVQNQLFAQSNRLLTHLQTTQSPDALLAMERLIDDFVYQDTLMELKQNWTANMRIKPQKYQSFLVPILVHLKACTLGYPCDADSDLSELLCLETRHEQAAQACGQTVMTHYFENRLSPQQRLDAEWALSHWN